MNTNNVDHRSMIANQEVATSSDRHNPSSVVTSGRNNFLASGNHAPPFVPYERCQHNVRPISFSRGSKFDASVETKSERNSDNSSLDTSELSYGHKRQTVRKLTEIKETVTAIKETDTHRETNLEERKYELERIEHTTSITHPGQGDSYDTPPKLPLYFNHKSYRPYVVPTRPVVCPITNCRRVVAATGFIPHFEFEHRGVSMLDVAVNESYTLILNPDQVMDNQSSCICLFGLDTLGRAKYDSFSDKLNDEDREKEQTRLTVPFTMMIARVYIQFSSEGVKEPVNNKPLSFLVVWVCGFDSTPEIYCSLEATYNNYRTKSCIYSGPITSLRETQNPYDLFRSGECLIISPGLVKSLCQDTSCIDINVSFH